MDDIIKELNLQMSGLVDPSTAVQMGRLLGARLVFTGTIDRLGADLVLSARIVDVQTGEIRGSRQVHCGQYRIVLKDDLLQSLDAARPLTADNDSLFDSGFWNTEDLKSPQER